MIKRTVPITCVLLYALLAVSCGEGKPEVVTADSSVTSSSINNVTLPDVVNTDTTTAAPTGVNDTLSLRKADSQRVTFPDAAQQPEAHQSGKKPEAAKKKAVKK